MTVVHLKNIRLADLKKIPDSAKRRRIVLEELARQLEIGEITLIKDSCKVLDANGVWLVAYFSGVGEGDARVRHGFPVSEAHLK